MFAGGKDTIRKLYRDAYEAFRRFLLDVGVDPASERWSRMPANALATTAAAASPSPAPRPMRLRSAPLLRQLLVEERLPSSISLEKLRLGLRQSLSRGDYLRRRVDPRPDAFVVRVADCPIPPASDTDDTTRLVALRARHELTALLTAVVLRGTAARRRGRARQG